MPKDKKRESDERTLENYLYTSDRLRMNSLVTEMMNTATTALKNSIDAVATFDLEEMEKVLASDDALDEYKAQIDQECLYSIAMRQPLREDLRYVYAVMKIITDIERIGDQSVNLLLCMKNYAEGYSGHGPFPKIDEMKKVGQRCSEMAEDFLEGLQNEDADVLDRINRKHMEAENICDAALEDLMTHLNSPHPSEPPVEILFTVDIFRYLKRITDHLVNLAEKVYFIATGISPFTLKKGMRQRDADFSS